MKNNLLQQIVLTTALLITVIAFFEMTDLDIWIQNHFYDFTADQWIINRQNPIIKTIFYSGVKKLLSTFGVTILLMLLFFRKKTLIKQYRQGLIILLMTGVLTPSIVSTLKTISNTPCPRQIVQYSGSYPNTKVFECYPKGFVQKSRARCWPAGHSSGGFALMSLFFVFHNKKNKVIGLMTGILLGWSMGSYKMLIGDHFISHTLITMLIAWLVALCTAKLVYSAQKLRRLLL